MAKITGTAGNDRLTGTAGADSINAGDGDDVIVGFAGVDTVDGGRGWDTIVLSATSADLNRAGNAHIVNIEAITAAGAAAAVTIDLHSQSEGFAIIGSAFNDRITGSGGNDVIDGGAGNDEIEGIGGDDRIGGGAGNDIVTGGAGADTLTGGAGDDIVYGGAGAGRLDGNAGNDLVIGGEKADTFVYSISENLLADRVHTFRDGYLGGKGADTLELHLTFGEFASAAVKADIVAFNAFEAQNRNGSPGKAFQFGSFDLQTLDIETLKVVLDNAGPTANRDFAQTSEDAAISGNVLINDVDPDHLDVIRVSAVVTQSSLGASVVVAADGTYAYDPTHVHTLQALRGGGIATDSFSYAISDLAGASSTSTVTITVAGVNDAPAAMADAGSTNSATAIELNVLANDSDIEGDPLSVASVGAASALGARISINADGTIQYDPGTSATLRALKLGEHLDDTFSYTVSDGHAGGTSTTTVTVTVNGHSVPLSGRAEDGYIAGATVFGDANRNGVLDPGEASGVTDGTGAFTLDNAGGPLVLVGGTDIATGLPFGGVLRAPEGYTTVTPLSTLVEAVMGADANLALAAAEQKVLAAFGVDANVQLSGFDPIAAAVSGDPATATAGAAAFVAASELLNAVVMVGAYISGAEGAPADAASQRVFDAIAQSVLASGGALDLADTSVLHDIVTAAAPAIAGAAASDIAQIVAASTTALDAQVQGTTGAALLAAASEVSIVAQGAASSSLANAGASGSTASSVEQFTGDALQDAVAAMASQTGDVDGPGVNNAPIAANRVLATFEDSALDIATTTLATDYDHDPLAFARFTQPSHGSVQDLGGGTIRYTPAADFYGTDSFTYVVSDGAAESSEATVTVEVAPVNDAPAVSLPPTSIFSGSLTGSLTSSAFSDDGRYLSYSLPAGTTAGVVAVVDLQTGIPVALSPTGGAGNLASISGDGRFVIYESTGSNVVPGDTNGVRDVFVANVSTGTRTLVSADAAGVIGNAASGITAPDISADGRLVMFDSAATNLVGGDTNGVADIFVKDLATGSVALVSTDSAGVLGNGASSNASMSDAGNRVVFVSASTNLTPEQSAGTFVKDIDTGAIAFLSASSKRPVISGDGEFVFYFDDQNVLARKDLGSGAVISVGGGDATASVSDDGRFIVQGVVVRDLEAGRGATLATNTSSLAFAGGTISGDGEYIAFQTTNQQQHRVVSTSVVHNPLAGTEADILRSISVGDVENDTLTAALLVHFGTLSLADTTGLDALNGNGSAKLVLTGSAAAINAALAGITYASADGADVVDPIMITVTDSAGGTATAVAPANYPAIAFPDHASTTEDQAVAINVLANDVNVGGTLTASTSRGAVSVSGGTVTFDPHHAFDTLSAGAVETVIFGYKVTVNPKDPRSPVFTSSITVDVHGVNDAPTIALDVPLPLVSTNAAGELGNGTSFSPRFSGDGRYVAFSSQATNLVPGDTNGSEDVYLKDLHTGAVTLVSTGPDGIGDGSSDVVYDRNSVSADGRYVVIISGAHNLAAGGAAGGAFSDVFVKDLATGAITLVDSGIAGAVADRPVANAGSISADGRYVVFASGAGNLVAGDTNGLTDAFLRDMQSGSLTRIVESNSARTVTDARISADGTHVLFDAFHTVAGDSQFDVFVLDLATGVTTPVNAGGIPPSSGTATSRGTSISPDGRYVVFESNLTGLLLGDTNGTLDVFWKDMLTGEVRLVSSDHDLVGNGPSNHGSVSDDGRFVEFGSNARNLGASSSKFAAQDIFVKDMQTGDLALLSGATGELGKSNASISADGLYVSYTSAAGQLVLAHNPLGSLGAVSTAEESPLVLPPISFGDADLGDSMTATLTVAHGVLSEADPVAGNATASLQLQGTAADVTAALAGLTYTPDAGFSGPDELTASVTDAAGANVTRTLPIGVTALNTVIQGGPQGDVLTGTGDADIFVITRADGSPATVTNFDAAQGDKLDLHEVVTGYDRATSALASFVSTREADGSTIVSVDADGIGGDFVDVAVLTGVTNTSVDLLASHANLVLA